MSFRTTRDVLASYRGHLRAVQGWCSDLKQAQTEPEFALALRLTHDELSTRSLSFQGAMETGEANSLDTFLQYEPTNELELATKRITSSRPTTASALFTSICDYYHILCNGLTECQNTAEGTPAADLFRQLEVETMAGISTLGWKMRSKT